MKSKWRKQIDEDRRKLYGWDGSVLGTLLWLRQVHRKYHVVEEQIVPSNECLSLKDAEPPKPNRKVTYPL